MGLGKRGWHGRSEGLKDLDLHDMSKYHEEKKEVVAQVNLPPVPNRQPAVKTESQKKYDKEFAAVMEHLKKLNLNIDEINNGLTIQKSILEKLVATDLEVHKEVEPEPKPEPPTQ